MPAPLLLSPHQQQARPRPRTLKFANPLNAELRARLDQATADDTCKGLFFSGLLSAARGLLGQTAEGRVHSALGGKKVVDFFDYPVSAFLPGVFETAELLQSDTRDFDSAMRQLGELGGILGTAVSRTLITLSAGDPTKLMRGLPTLYKTAVSYGTRELVAISDNLCVLKVRRDLMPCAYHEGMILSLLRGLGCQGAVVRPEKIALLDTDYRVTWR